MRELTIYIKAFLLSVVMLLPLRLVAVGWTPTDGGLVVNLEQGDKFLLSVMVDHDNNKATPDREYFVANYTRYKGDDYFVYKFDEKDSTQGHWLKLIQQSATATEPAEMIIWEIGAPLARGQYDLGAIDGTLYTIWNDGKTLRTNSTNYQFMGDLTSDYGYKDACDVVFVIPTDQASRTSFDPNKTLRNDRGRTDQDATTGKINGKIGTGFLGMTYREVYMLDIPRNNLPRSYSNASLVTFNTTTKQKSWSNGQIKCDPGKAAYAFADDKHKPTTRTLFRLYMLTEPINSCNSYFFATDLQSFIGYRKGPDDKDHPTWTWTDSTDAKKVHSWDHFYCMDTIKGTTSFQTEYMTVPVKDSTYYYVGYNNDYKAEESKETMGGGAYSQFEKISSLPLKTMPTFKAPAGAYGRMVIDTTCTDNNHAVKFKPYGYFLKVSTGKNVRMRPNADSTVWTTQDMWTIDGTWATYTIKATLMTGPEFSEEDPGADVAGWSVDVKGAEVPVSGGGSIAGASGYAQITVTDAEHYNGNMTFLVVNKASYLHYSNNGFLGDTVPDQYPTGTDTHVTVQAPRIKADYEFLGWTKNATPSEGEKHYKDGDTINLPAGKTTLYAQATYNGTLQVAISFMQDSKRYYLNHPGALAPRYSRARHYANWETTWQGMANAENMDPNYLSTFELRHPSNEINHKDEGVVDDLSEREKVLDPRRYTMRGYEDSLTFYEYFSPARDEYLGLYYTTPNTILANNTWAGLFETNSVATTTGWPDYMTPYISDVKLKSTRYVEEYDATKPDSLILKERSNKGAPWVQYDPATDQFNGTDDASKATVFDISAVIVADGHYVIIPDTSYEWRDTIEFGYHKNEQQIEKVWSSLIGKQFLAVMVAGTDTVYFHPNRKKIIKDPNNLYLSSDFRVSQYFTLIRDSRVVTPISAGDSVMRQETPDYWCNEIISGLNSPMDIRDAENNPIDIVDTFRINLSHGAISKIKEYRGRWNKNAPGLHMVNSDGSARYRDVIIRTKTYHYGASSTRYVLKPERESYSFGPLVGQSQTINFILTQETYKKLLDSKGNEAGEEVTNIDTIKTGWSISTDTDNYCYCAVKHFPSRPDVSGSSVTLTVIDENTTGVNYDTLLVKRFLIGETPYTVDVRVPLVQAALQESELIWSVVDNGKRYFITASKGASEDKDKFIFRQYNQNGSTLYQQNTKTALIKGAVDAGNNNGRYITPWEFKDFGSNQISLKTILVAGSDTLRFKIDGTPKVSRTDSTVLTYKFVNTYVNDNANYEEQVKLQYTGVGGTSNWLKYSNDAFSLTTEAEASVFSWSYMQLEYSLLNNGTYPSQKSAEFGYNSTTAASIQTRYKAYKEYTMLLNNKQVDLCRSEEVTIANLVNAGMEWKTDTAFSIIRDGRTFDGGAKSSGLTRTTNPTTLTTTITPAGDSPKDVKIGGEYVNIVDTLSVSLSLKGEAPAYRFKGDWENFTTISDANLKIPLIRKTYHDVGYDSLTCVVGRGHNTHTFPAKREVGKNDTVVFSLSTLHRTGTHVVDVNNYVVDVVSPSVSYVNVSGRVDLNNKLLAEARLVDEYGNTPTWCAITAKGDSTIKVACKEDGILAPRSAYIYVAYIAYVVEDGSGPKDPVMRFVNTRLTVSQGSQFESASNQVLDHSAGASGDAPAANGLQQVHENRRILYYYPDEEVELPVRERGFYGWWRWYRESNDPTKVESDIPDSVWIKPPENTGRYKFPFRTIGDTVLIDPSNPSSGKKYVTQGRYTVFHYPAKDDAGARKDPPSKNPTITPPATKFRTTAGEKYPIDTIAVDISNYYDNLPMSTSHKNQIDTAMLDTMKHIPEPTLSLREIFELHPWTEMADTLWNYRSEIPGGEGELHDKTYELASEKYMEDHEMFAPIGNRLLLETNQRYNLKNLQDMGFSDSQLGYFMHDDNGKTESWTQAQKDSMIWLGGWDADCEWFTYDTLSKTYTPCTYSLTKENDFLSVPAKSSITAGHEFDTVYYCLRARSKQSTWKEPTFETVDGRYWYNICRYKIIYHDPKQYGPLKETTVKGVSKAIITNTEIEQRYEVLERLNFDYIRPGKNYHVYPHPLPWEDASYGYTYPETPDLPHNRLHDQTDFPNFGEYGLINKIPYSQYWHMMEQHGGAANGYMIYCDGMASAGQVAALSLETKLCEGQKMFFSAFVGNPSSQKGKANPNFTFSVQGRKNGAGHKWEDITSYMTGDIQPANVWSQICFPILQEHNYDKFRVRIYNMSSDFDGNDFIIDDMCIFATKPPLIAYQASTACVDNDKNDSTTNVIIRVDYQGITGDELNGVPVYYTIEADKGTDTTFIAPIDGYFNQTTSTSEVVGKPDTIYGWINMPLKEYNPPSDSIYTKVSDLIAAFDTTITQNPESPSLWLRSGYVLENLEGAYRPVLYFVHKAKMATDIRYKVHMSHSQHDLMDSKCALTSDLKVNNRMLLEINGEEQPEMTVVGMCANATYNLSLRIKTSVYMDNVAPMDVNGSCINDWLLYGDTVEVSSLKRYGYKYKDIVTMVKDILRYEPSVGKNKNQFASSLAAVKREEMVRIQHDESHVTLSEGVDAYTMLCDLVNKGFLTLYKKQITVTVNAGDSVEYVILPIVGTGSEAMSENHMEVCPYPLYIKLTPDKTVGTIPLIIGGLHRDSTELSKPITVLVNEQMANERIVVKIDSIQNMTAIHSITFHSTDDPDFIEGVHSLTLRPEKVWHLDGQSNNGYYQKNDTLVLMPAAAQTYHMRAGYNYTFTINMMSHTGSLTQGDCRIGEIPFTVGVVPNYVRWDPKGDEDNKWTNADNWIGVNEHNEIIDSISHFVPMNYTNVIIPAMTGGKPYPIVQPIPTAPEDSIKKVNFQYNQCNVVRFLPGAAIGQQQNMEYTGALVDMQLPYRKWALRAAPVEGMLSGDLFVSEAELSNETPLWETGAFDASGRNYKTGNATFWLSIYNRDIRHITRTGSDSVSTAATTWSKVTNALDQPMLPGQGWAVFARTAEEGTDPVVRLPKTDDVYYYYGTYGERLDDRYVKDLQAKRDELAGGAGKAGYLTFHPEEGADSITLINEKASTSFVFGNPTMGYIDIWGFIADNTGEGKAGLQSTFEYMNEHAGAASVYEPVTIESADALSENKLSSLDRYLPPMHVIVLKVSSAATKLKLRLNTNRVITDIAQVERPLPTPTPAPKRSMNPARRKGIMTVTATNATSARYTSYLLLGHGYHNDILEGEDAVLTTINIDNYSSTNWPTTPFNLYAVEGSNGLSIDLRDSIVNIPLSFYMSDLEREPITRLWFTGVNNIDDPLVLYDALLETERPIIDGIGLDVETPDVSHQLRYYIRRRGYNPKNETNNDTPTGFGMVGAEQDKAIKIVHNGIVYIIRNGHIYTALGQKVK